MLKYVLTDQKGRTGMITLNRPEKRNAMNPKLVSELYEAFDLMENDDGVKTIVLKAMGKVFSAGADLQYLKEMQAYSYEENLEDSNNLKSLYQKIYNNKKVIIAQVEGHAIAGGCGLATVCDFVFSVPEAKFGYTESRIGFVPALVMVYLLRKAGEGMAKPLLLNGGLIDAHQAKRAGIVYEIMESDRMENEVLSFSEMLNESVSAQSAGIIKEMISKVQSMDLDSGLEFASTMNAKARGNKECIKGIQNFLNKERIKW